MFINKNICLDDSVLKVKILDKLHSICSELQNFWGKWVLVVLHGIRCICNIIIKKALLHFMWSQRECKGSDESRWVTNDHLVVYVTFKVLHGYVRRKTVEKLTYYLSVRSCYFTTTSTAFAQRHNCWWILSVNRIYDLLSSSILLLPIIYLHMKLSVLCKNDTCISGSRMLHTNLVIYRQVATE